MTGVQRTYWAFSLAPAALIVLDLVARLAGTIRVENRGGAVYSIMFPAPEATGSGGGDR